jgi:hypothetical protein
MLPLIPKDVTPWLTALRAYSAAISAKSMIVPGVNTDQSAPTFRCNMSATILGSLEKACSYLGENVVREKEYRSAMAVIWGGRGEEDHWRKWVQPSVSN